MQKITRLVAPIRRYAQILLLAAGLLLPSAAFAAQNNADAPAETWGDQKTPDNFVRSKGPSEDGETYKWLQMGYAGLVMVGMVGFMVWLVKRTPRKARDKSANKED